MSASVSLLSFPEELLERILEEVVLFKPPFPSSSPSSSSSSSSEAPSRTLGPSPIFTPSSTPKSSPSATRHVSPRSSPVLSRAPSPPFGPPTSSASVVASPATDASAPTAVVTRLELALAPLLTCRQFSRIALPLYYRVVVLKTRAQAAIFLHHALGSGKGEVGPASDERPSANRDARRRRVRWIRKLVLGGVWKEGGEVVRALAELVRPPLSTSQARSPLMKIHKGKGKAKASEEKEGGLMEESEEVFMDTIALKVLEITINAPPPSPYGFTDIGRAGSTPNPAKADEDAEIFSSALRAYADSWSTGRQEPTHNPLKHIVLRKPQNVYLSQPRAKTLIAAVAGVVESADSLESAFVAFRISDDPVGMHPYQQYQQHQHSQGQQQQSSPLPQPQLGPITQLTLALACRPKLKTFATMLPSVWNESVLRVSCNEALERVVLLGVHGLPVCGWPAGPEPSHLPAMSYTTLPPPPPGARPSWIVTSTTPAVNAPAATASQGSSGGGRRPRLAVVLPTNPVERVYASSARGVDGYALAATGPSPSPANSQSPASSVGYGGGVYVPGYMSVGTGTGLFLNQARKHERLSALIRAGAVDEMGEAQCGVRRSSSSAVPVIAAPVPLAVKKVTPPVVVTGGGVSLAPSSSSSGSGSTLYTSCSSWLSAKFSGGHRGSPSPPPALASSS